MTLVTVLAIALGFLAVFGVGIATGAAIARSRYRRDADAQRAIEAARLQGRLDRGDDRPGLDPPAPWRD